MFKRTQIIEDYDKILKYISNKSDSMYEKMLNNKNADYLLIVKNITHSDLITSGKRLGINQSLEFNYLYYLSLSQMKEIEEKTKRTFETAKQSNISVPNIFFEFFDIPKLERRKGQQKERHTHIKINDYANVYLVNDTLKYFDIKYTKQIFEKLNKKVNNKFFNNYNLKLSNSNYTEIQLTQAIHGIGVSKDIEFNSLRKNIFKNDTIIFLLKKEHQKQELYIILDKNPIFYTIIGLSNTSWEKYLRKERIEEKNKLSSIENLNEKNRSKQSKWRMLLAEEMINYTPNEDEIFCPLTYIRVNFKNMGTLFRASHIKAFTECTTEEAYDINNGIIMIANADALFDKHLISIDENGTLLFSYLFDKDYKLKQELRLTEKVFSLILNKKRLEYLKYHREVFYLEEKKRKKEKYTDIDILY